MGLIGLAMLGSASLFSESPSAAETAVGRFEPVLLYNKDPRFCPAMLADFQRRFAAPSPPMSEEAMAESPDAFLKASSQLPYVTVTQGERVEDVWLIDIDIDNDGQPETLLRAQVDLGPRFDYFAAESYRIHRGPLELLEGETLLDLFQRSARLLNLGANDPRLEMDITEPDGTRRHISMISSPSIVDFEGRRYLLEESSTYMAEWNEGREYAVALTADGRGGSAIQCVVLTQMPLRPDEDITRVPTVASLLAVLDEIQGPLNCASSTYRNWNEISLQETVLRGSRQPWKFPRPWEDGTADEVDGSTLVRFDQHLRYLRRWGNLGLWNKRLFRNFEMRIGPAIEGLSSHYVRALRLAPDVARLSAKRVIWSLVAAKITPANDLYLESGPLAEVDRLFAQELTPEQLAAELAKRKWKRPQTDQALKYAVVNRMPADTLALLLAQGAKSDTGEESALMRSVGDGEAVGMLLRRGADPNYRNRFGKTALMYAAQFDLPDSAARLLQRGADPNLATELPPPVDPANPPAWTESTQPFLEYLLRTCPDAVTVGKRTALMYAAENGSLPLLRLLVEGGADRAAEDTGGRSALDYLSKNTRLTVADREAAEALLVPGATATR